jgi:tetratricopeptide (TPR) repeat protein
MKPKKTLGQKTVAQASRPVVGKAVPQPTGIPPMWTTPWALVIPLVALIMVFWAYAPALRGGFLFDDTVQQFAIPAASAPLGSWIGPVRPVLMFSYWINSQISGQDAYSFHVFNVLFHCITTFLIFLIVRRLVGRLTGLPNQTRDLLAAFAALLFLLHPAQTESVAYIAGRSESLSALFAAAAYAVFLYRPAPATSWVTAAALLALFALAVFSKEQAIVLPALFLLTDLWLNPGHAFQTIRGNWRLYLPIAAVGLAAVAVFRKLIMSVGTGTGGGSAGFGMKDLTWYQYLFTQFRAVFVYIRTFLFPANLTLDWDFPISKTILDHGAIAGLVVLAALAAAAWHFRSRFPLAAFGYFVFLLLLSPTSSILPIRDPVAERRMYLPMLGLLLILVDFVSRLRIHNKAPDRNALAAACLVVLLVAAAVTHARAEVWSGPVSLWEDTVRKSPNKARDRLQLALAYYDQGSFDRAVAEYQKAAELVPPDYNLLLDWALAYDGLNQPGNALAKLRQAAAMEPTAHVYSQIGMVYGKRRQWKEAMEALDLAEKIDPRFAMTYYYKGVVHLSTMDAAAAAADFARALAQDPTLQPAREGLAQAQQAQRALQRKR